MNDSRIAQMRQEVKAAQAVLDDLRCLMADMAAETPDMNSLDHADFSIARSSTRRALLKVNSVNASLARMEDRAARQEKITAQGWR